MIVMADWAGYIRFRDAFANIMDDRYYTISWLDQQILTGQIQFWGSDEAALLTQFKHFPAGAVDLHVMIAAGDMREIVEILRPRAEQFAKDAGCTACTVESTVGWSRALAPFGYAIHQTTLKKELSGGLIKK